MFLISKPLKVFFFTAYKPIEGFFELLEELMKMEKIMSTNSEYWAKHNDEIPKWFYQMLISMGISVFIGFFLILLGSL